MKTINRLLFVVLMAGLIASCSDIVDIDQPGTLNPSAAFNSVADLEGGLLGVYAELDNTSQIFLNNTFTDQISIGISNGGQGRGGGLYEFEINTGSSIAEIVWTRNYDAINAATRLITAAQDVEVGEGEQPRFNSVIGQARAVRAYAHMNLMTYYAEDMADDASLGVIVVEEIPNISDARNRNTTGETYDFILSELELAEDLIPSSLSDVTRFTQESITAMRARIATYRENYGPAETFSQELIDQFPLADPAEYIDMFRLDTPGEVIFKLERTVGDPYERQAAPGGNGTAIAGGWVGATISFTGPDEGFFFELSRSTFTPLDSADVRLGILASPVAMLNPDYPDVDFSTFRLTSIIPVNKYRGSVPGENVPLMNDLKIFRASEMQLINAEAQVDAGNLPGAALLVQELRSARYGEPRPLPVYGSPQEAFADILAERRIELAFEGHRYVDLGRLGARANRGIERAPADCEPYGACGGPVPGGEDDFLYRLPIPQVEINGNQNIRQNPGYSGGANSDG